MAIFESLFDALYLSLVIGLGVRLLLEKKKEAKLFGVMAILLGFGDAFHLIPRIVSHLSPLGFEGHAFALSWGKFVTSITMTLFYVLYYHYYRSQSGDTDNKKRMTVYALALIRMVLVALPQNVWGQVPGDYMFGILRNIPFAVLGGLLIYWSYQERAKDGLRRMWLLILLSFLFYIPVVLWSEQFSLVGALMMPKTAVYLMIVIEGCKYFVGKFKRFHILGIAFVNLIMGLLAGVFYREFTKFYNYVEVGHLGKLHVHTLALGFIVTLLIYLFATKSEDELISGLKKPIYIFESGLIFTVVNMMVIGMYEVVNQGQETIPRATIDGISGLGHVTLAVGLVWMIVSVYRFEKRKLAL